MAASGCRASLLALCSLCCVSVLSTHVPRAGSLSFNLSFSKPQSPTNIYQLINRTGDAELTLDTLELTKNKRDQTITNSTGRAMYAQPVPLWDVATGEMASFTTTFEFQITLPNITATPGDGMAFFLGPVGSGIPPESGGGSLGLLPYYTSNGTGDTTMLAVEIDTFLNLEYADISSNHVAIDVNSLISRTSTDTTSPTRNLTSGYKMVATVRYENVTKFLSVELRINDDTSYYVNATVDLRSYLPDHVAVGFSAATGDAGELHKILSWSFTSTLEEPSAPAPASPPVLTPGNIQNSKKKTVIIAVLVPLLFLSVCGTILVWQKKRKRRRSIFGGRGTPPNETSDDDSECEAAEQRTGRAELERGVVASGPRRYAYRELAAATNNFNDDNKLGHGGFGSVYQGTLAVSGEERPVAIKVFSSESSKQGRKEFEAEVRIISQLKHRNLVQLMGWCDSRHGLLLVYELVAQGSLHKHLHNSDSDNESFLTWPQRYQIILGLGAALRYLHQEWKQCVVHGDIKPSNIMLDESLGARLGDFGLARLGDHGARLHATRAVKGTTGYIDPEFVNTGHPSTHSDVYSFGIVLLEIVSSLSPVVEREGEPPFVLLKWVWGLYGQNVILDAADKRLRAASGEADNRCMERVLVVGLWCAHPDQSERPSIEEAMHVLLSEDARLPKLTPQMYRAVAEFAVVTGHSIGSLCVQSSSSTTTTTGGHSKVSSESESSALLRDSRELA